MTNEQKVTLAFRSIREAKRARTYLRDRSILSTVKHHRITVLIPPTIEVRGLVAQMECGSGNFDFVIED